MLLQVFTTSKIIMTATTVVPFCFQSQLWGAFTSTKKFLSVASSEALIQRFAFMKYGTSIRRFSFKIDVQNIYRKFLEKQQSSLIFNIGMINMYSVANDFLGISQKFSEQLFQRTQLVGCFWFRLITCFSICNTFARMPDWNLQNIKQKLSNNLRLNFCYFKIICFLHQCYQQKITRYIKKKKKKKTSVTVLMMLY